MRIEYAIARALAMPLIFALTPLCVLAAAAPQAQTQFIRLERGAVDEVFADRDRPVARFPVTLEGVRADAIRFRIIEVLLGKQRESRLIEAFTPTLEPEAEMRGQAILVTVDLTKASEQGTYNLIMEAVASDGSVRQPLELQIIVPAAKLRPPGTLIVEQVIPFFFFNPASEKTPLELTEVSGRSRLTNVTSSRLPASGDEARPLSGYIELGNVEAVPPRGTRPVSYDVRGDFPLGITKGAVEVVAPQLAEPLVINYEVRSRMSRWIIFLFIGLGLLAGYYVRTRLKREIELGRARLKALDLQERIRREIQRRQDEEFRRRLAEAMDRLETAARRNQAEALTPEIGAADTALTDALNDLKQRRQLAQARLDELVKLAATRWLLPRAVRAPLESIEGPLEEARQELDKDNVKGAGERLERIRAGLARSLQEPVMAWRTMLTDYLHELSKPDALLPASVIQKLKQAVDSLKPIFDKISQSDLDATAEQIGAMLDKVHEARINVDQLMLQLGIWLQTTAAEVAAVLTQVQVPDQEALGRLGETIAGFGDVVADSPAQPRRALEELPGEMEKLRRAWSDALLNQVPDAEKADKDEVIELVKDRRYVDAARKVVQVIEQKKRASSAEGAMLGGGRRAAELLPRIESILSSWFARPAPAAAPAVVTRGERADEVPEPLETQRVRTMRELFRDTLLQTVLVGILIAVAGYLLFSEKFIGTFQDIAGVFFWAFGIDITVDALLQAAKGAKTS